MKSARVLLIGLLAFVAAVTAAPKAADDLHVMVSGAFTAPYNVLAAEWQKTTGHTIATVYGASMGSTPTSIPSRLARGEPADVVILVRSALDALAKAGRIIDGSQVDLVRSRIGMAVKAGAPVPDISTEARFRQVLLAAKSVAYSDSASGVYISTQLWNTLGIADAMTPKSRKIEGTPVGDVVAKGEAELGFQQISELMPVRGITLVGPIPASVQLISIVSGAIVVTSRSQETARQLLAFLSSKAAAETIRRSGLDPIAATAPAR